MPTAEAHHDRNVPPVRARISVVDDDDSFLRSLGRLLRSGGYQVQTFSSAQQLLSALPGCAPNCLVLDMQMPGMTGLQLQEELRNLGYCMPIIFVTAFDTPQTREQAHKGGSFGLLLKPFQKEALFRAIESALMVASGN